MGIKKTFFKNAAISGGYNYLSWFFDTLVSTIILSRLLTPAEYGFVAIITIFSGFITLFANTGLSYAIIRSDYGNTYHRIIFSVTVWIGVLLCLSLSLLAYPITLLYHNPELFWPTIVISLQFLTNSLNIVPTAILTKRLEFNFIGLTNLITVIVTIGIMILMAAFGFSYWAIILNMVIQPVIRHIFLEWKLRFGFPIYGWKLTKLGFKRVRSLVENFSIFNFINYFARNADNFAVSKFYGAVSLGLYDRAYKFLYMGRRLINAALGPVLMPSLIKAKENGEDYKPHFLDILSMINVLNLLIAIPLTVFPKTIVMILWGKNWIGVADFLPYIGAIIPMQTLSIAAMDLYVIEKKEKALVTLEIPLTLILVLGIVVGAFFSAVHIIRFYAIAFIIILMPLELYLAHYKLFHFVPAQLVRFWVPKLVITGGMIFSIWFGHPVITGFLMAAFVFETVYFKFDDVKDIYKMILSKLKKGFSSQE